MRSSSSGETESTRNLIRNFFLARQIPQRHSRRAPAEKIAHAAVIGAGVMGSGIAQWLSSRGVSVILRDVNSEAARSRPRQHRENLRRSGQARSDERGESEARPRAHCRLHQSRCQMRDVQIVIEAASEKLEIKKANLRRSRCENSTNATFSRPTPPRFRSANSRRTTELTGARHRPAFFQSGQPDEADRSRVGKQTAPTKRTSARSPSPGRSESCRWSCRTARVSRQSRLFPYLLDAAELFENGVNAKEIDDALRGVGDADGAAAFDRRDRRRYHGRYRGHAGESVWRARSRA